ncbi:hypothetical protein B0A53_01231 [Rhodotorula sp. CCFEE 5036]|nr:hypothetical protein B0A53_01231 [Rhodotorula sp. CCFEE 5036]
MSSAPVSSLLYNTTIDDRNAAIQFTGPWTRLTDNTTGWQHDTLTYCGGSSNASTWFGVNGYTDSRQGVFSCRLEYPLANGTIVPARLPWGWYDGAHTNGARANPISLCSAYGLPYELYTLVVTVQPDQVSKGLGIDSVTYAYLDEVPGGPAWFSNMNSAIPPTALRNTTATPMLPPSTSSATTTNMPTSLQGGGNSGGISIGLGVGLGGLFVILAILGAWYLFRVRRRASARKSALSQRSTSLHSLSWTPDMHSLRSSIAESPATGSSTCLWLGGPNAASATMREYDASATGPTGSSRPRADTPDFTIVESSQGPFDDRYAASEFSAAGTYGSEYHRSSLGAPPVIITPASDAGTIGPSPFDDPIDSPTIESPVRADLDDLDLDAPLEHPDSFKPR